MRIADRGSRIGHGSVYVAIVVAALGGYFIYQAWFNPSRAVKRRLGEIAGVLSVPDGEPELARVARLRGYLAPDVRVRADGSEFANRDTIVGALAGLQPPKGGWNIQFVDVQVATDSESTAHAGLMLEINTHDPRTGEWLADQHETIVNLQKQNGEWVVVTAEIRSRSPR